MQIIESKDWGMKITSPLSPLNLSRVDAIALHHMASPTADIYEVERWHLGQNWRAFGYNYWIGFDGTVYEGRGLHMGAGVANQNDHILSIGFQGNYQSGLSGVALSPPMGDAQFNAGIDLIHWLQERVPTIKTVAGHKDFMATACPGDQFPLKEMQTGKRRGGKTCMFQDINGHYAQKHIEALFEMGVINGKEETVFAPDEPVTRGDCAIMVRNAIRYITGK